MSYLTFKGQCELSTWFMQCIFWTIVAILCIGKSNFQFKNLLLGGKLFKSCISRISNGARKIGYFEISNKHAANAFIRFQMNFSSCTLLLGTTHLLFLKDSQNHMKNNFLGGKSKSFGECLMLQKLLKGVPTLTNSTPLNQL